MTEWNQIALSGENETVRPGFRYFGYSTPARGKTPPKKGDVTIGRIMQYQSITDVVSALHDIPQGDVWTLEKIGKRKIEIEFKEKDRQPEPEEFETWPQTQRDQWYQDEYTRLRQASTDGTIDATGLRWDTVESLSFSEAIKSWAKDNQDDLDLRDTHIRNFKQSLTNLHAFDIHNVIGNFMPVADWTRTGYKQQPNGSMALEYEHAAFTAFDVFILKRLAGPNVEINKEAYIEDGSYSAEELAAGEAYWHAHLENDIKRRVEIEKMIVAGLPGCQGIINIEALEKKPLEEQEAEIEAHLLPAYRTQVAKYKGWTKDDLRERIDFFLKEVAPVADSLGINLCSHPDDPAVTPFMGTPRSVGTVEDYTWLMDHGCSVNLCPGSLLANPENREKGIITMILELAAHGKALGWDIHKIFPHVHLRPIVTHGKDFIEGEHAEHIEDLRQSVMTLAALGWHGVFRPDHSTTPTYEMEAIDRLKDYAQEKGWQIDEHYPYVRPANAVDESALPDAERDDLHTFRKAVTHLARPFGGRGYHGAGRAEGASIITGLFAGAEMIFGPEIINAELKQAGKEPTEQNRSEARLNELQKRIPLMGEAKQRKRPVPNNETPSGWGLSQPDVLKQLQATHER